MMKRALLIAAAILMAVPATTLAHSKRRGDGPRMRSDRHMVALAYQLEEATEKTYRMARRTSFRVGHRQKRALDQMRELRHEARDFRRRVENRRGSRYRLEKALHELERDYFRAANSLDRARGFHPVVRNRVARMERTLRKIQREVNARIDYAGHRHDHRRDSRFTRYARRR